MKKQLYLEIKTRLKQITDINDEPIFKHFDLWNRQVEFLEQETPFEFPAVFVEFMPQRWQTMGQRRQQSELVIKLHIVTRWFAQTADYSPLESEALDYLDLPEKVSAIMQSFEASSSNKFVRLGSTTNHDHTTILDSIEEYTTMIWSDSAVAPMVTVDVVAKVVK
jgi:hypothetical protein